MFFNLFLSNQKAINNKINHCIEFQWLTLFIHRVEAPTSELLTITTIVHTPDNGEAVIAFSTPHSPFISVRSVDAAVVGDVGRLAVVGVEEEEDVGVEAGVGHDGHPDKRLEYCAPGLGAPAHQRRAVKEGSRGFRSAWRRLLLPFPC